MEGVLEFNDKPVLFECSSGASLEELLKSAKQISSESNFILLLDNDEKIIGRLLPAFVNARIRVKDRIARSKSVRMETLLFAAGTMNIGKALREVGAKNVKDFLLFATDKKLLKAFVKGETKVVREIRLDFDRKAAGDVALTELKGY